MERPSLPKRRTTDLLDAAFTAGLEYVQNAILLADERQSFIYANRAAGRLLGYTHEELLQMRVADIAPTEDQDLTDQLWVEFMSTGTQHGEFRIRRKDGIVRVFQYSAVANVLPGVHMSDLHDITEYKLAADRERLHAERNQVLVEEMHHRIKNMLANIQALLRSQASVSKDPAESELISRCLGRLQAMGEVTRLARHAQESGQVPVAELLSEVMRSTVGAFAPEPENVEWTVTGGKALVSWDTASPLALLINECVTNHLKYSTGLQDRLTIAVCVESSQQELQNLQFRFSIPFSAKPEDWRPSFGLHLLKLLCAQIDVQLTWLNEGESAGFEVAFKGSA